MSTYSFMDVGCVVSHPSYGRYVVPQGSGLGSVTVTQSTDRTAQDVAADGGIMVSKIEGNNGNIAIQAQQTSGFNKWLLGLWNYLLKAPASEWARVALTLRSTDMGDLVNATGGAFQQRAELAYQAQGQQRTWNLMFTDIQETNVAE